MAENIPNDNTSLPASWRSLAPIMMATGAICVLVSLGLFYFSGGSDDASRGFRAFFHSYLANYMYCLCICLGALFFVLVQHVTRAGWSASIRRIAELFAVTIPWWALLFLPILGLVVLTDSGDLYKWNLGVENDQVPAIVKLKLDYLNKNWFTLRTIIYFAVWIIVGRYYFKLSRQQDEIGGSEISLKLQKWSGPGIILFALSLNFAAFDWMMSTDAEWFSTIYGVYLFSASMLSFFAAMIVTCVLLQKNGRLEKLINTEHFHDLAKYQFGFVVFWTYIAFSQYLLYWYGNIPEETLWYKHRMENGWQYLGLALILLHFVVPFLGTLPRAVRRNRSILACWSTLILFAHWLDMSFLIMPNVGPASFAMLFGHFVCWIGMVSIFLALFLFRVGDTPLVAMRNPWLPDAFAYHNM